MSNESPSFNQKILTRKIRDLWREGCLELQFCSRPDLEARLLLEKAASWETKEIIINFDLPCPADLAHRYKRLLKRRKQGCPLALILGEKEFWSLPLKVEKGVFIPRPETEVLVELVLKLPLRKNGLVADIGTGCGPIACALARERPEAKIIAIDISRRALRLAKENADRLGLKNIRFVSGSLFQPLNELGLKNQFDLIISNPPYVSENQWISLPIEIREFEPKRALVAGPSGLEFIFRLIKEAPTFLRPGGFLAFEFGLGQLNPILTFLKNQGWQEISWERDLAGIPRVVAARFKPDQKL